MVSTGTCGKTRQSEASNWNFALFHLYYHIGAVFSPSDADVDIQGWFYVFTCVGASSTYGTALTWPHRDTDSQAHQKASFRHFLDFLFLVLPFQLELTVVQWNLHSLQVWQSLQNLKYMLGSQKWAIVEPPLLAVTFKCPLSTHPWCANLFGLSLGGKTLEGLNWSGMQKGFTSKPLFCPLTPFVQHLMHENRLCCVLLLCTDLSEGLNMQRTIRLCSLMISSASVWGVMEDSIKDQQILIDTPSVKDDCITKNTKIKKKKGNYFLSSL